VVPFAEFIHPVTSLHYIETKRKLSPKRGGDLDQILLKWKAFWIHKLKTLVPHGLNVYFDLNLT